MPMPRLENLTFKRSEPRPPIAYSYHMPRQFHRLNELRFFNHGCIVVNQKRNTPLSENRTASDNARLSYLQCPFEDKIRFRVHRLLPHCVGFLRAWKIE